MSGVQVEEIINVEGVGEDAAERGDGALDLIGLHRGLGGAGLGVEASLLLLVGGGRTLVGFLRLLVGPGSLGLRTQVRLLPTLGLPLGLIKRVDDPPSASHEIYPLCGMCGKRRPQHLPRPGSYILTLTTSSSFVLR
ncbi:MAG: hypothetical protein WCK70_01855 [Chloroflexales bacterium]